MRNFNLKTVDAVRFYTMHGSSDLDIFVLRGVKGGGEVGWVGVREGALVCNYMKQRRQSKKIKEKSQKFTSFNLDFCCPPYYLFKI